MQQEINRIGILVALPLLLATLAFYYIGEADAYESEENISHTSSSIIELVSEGPSITPIIGIIGIEVLDEEEDEVRTNNIKKKHASPTHSSDGPYAEVIVLRTENKGVYQIIVRVYAMQKDLREGSLVITSDAFKKIEPFPKVKADSFVSIKTKMRADDPSTITAEILKYEGTFEPPICYQRDRCVF